jgi:hypothetical protein
MSHQNIGASNQLKLSGRLQLIVAAIGLLGSLLGVLAGGTLTYVLNQNAERLDARGDARVLEEVFVAADDAMKRSLIDNQYRFYKLTTGLPFADQKRLATHLTPRQYEDVATAEADLVLQDARSREKRLPGYGFVEDDRIQLFCERKALAKARMALNDFSQLPDPTARKDLQRFTTTCSRGMHGGHV